MSLSGLIRAVINCSIVLTCVVLMGCQDGGAPGRIYFSPDGSVAAYTYVKRIDLPLPPEMPTIHSTVYLQWCPAHQLKNCRTLKIDSYGKSYGSFVQGRFQLAFSHDSRGIAVNSPRYLEVVDLETRRRERLTDPDEQVTSMGWLGNGEMVYVAHSKTQNRKYPYNRIRKIYRHPIGNSPEKRRILYAQDDYRGITHDYVSPTGEFVVFISQGYSEGYFNLLNTATGKVTPLNDTAAQCQGVSWKPDGSAVFCLSSKEAFVHYPLEDRTKDVSKEYDDSFRRHLEFGPSIDNLWTPDGEYIVLNSSKTGGCLIRPDPWHVVSTGVLLVNHLEKAKHLKVYRNSPGGYPYLFVQPLPGWVRLWVHLVTDKKPYLPGQTVVLEARNYLADYEGKRFLPMKTSDSPGGAWTLTPDGRKIVFFDHSIFLDEEPVHFPKDIFQ